MQANHAHESILNDFLSISTIFYRFLLVPLCFRRFQSDFNQNLSETTISARFLRFLIDFYDFRGLSAKTKAKQRFQTDFTDFLPISDRFQTEFGQKHRF